MAQIGNRAQIFARLGVEIRQAMSEIYTALRGLLTIRDNVKIVEVTHTFGGVADTEENVTITDMGWIPTRVATIEVDDGAVVYPSTAVHTGWTTTVIKMKSSKAGTVWVGQVW